MSRKTFTKADRLRKRREYLFLSSTGRRIHEPFFTALVASAAGDCSRLGVTVSKRVGKAVRRNRIKRLTRECFRHHRDRMRGGWDVNIIAKPGAAELPAKEVFNRLQRLMDRISRSAGH